MPLYNLYSESIQVIHKASFLSKATLFHYFCLLVKFVFPLVLVYNSEGLWRKSDFQTEKPHVNFKHQMILALELNKPGSTIIWTTFASIQQTMDAGLIRSPRIEVSAFSIFKMCNFLLQNYEMDLDGDGRQDLLKLNLSVPLNREETVKGIKLILLFDYQLHNWIKFRMDGLAVINHRDSNGHRLKVVGELRFRQTVLLPEKNTWYDRPIIEAGFPDTLDVILERYLQRDYSTYIGPNNYFLWEPGESDEFKLDLTITYPEECYHCRNGIWFLLKWAWIQYMAVYFVINIVVKKLETIVYSNQFVDTVVFQKKHPTPFIKKFL